MIGKSNRTFGKHVLLNKIMGREAGTMSRKLPFIYPQYTAVDLCAGDGLPSTASPKSSPEIITRHMLYMSNRGIKTSTFLFEKDENTFDILKKNYPESENKNSSELESIPGARNINSACFLHADPNSINDWPINRNILASTPKFTTCLITMGCNVGGLKRLKLDERLQWFEKMDSVLRWLPKWHDALLISLKGDSSQWAYLVTGPKKWHEQGCYINDATSAFSYWESGIDLVQFKSDIDQFIERRDHLFLTKGEFDAKHRRSN